MPQCDPATVAGAGLCLHRTVEPVRTEDVQTGWVCNDCGDTLPLSWACPDCEWARARPATPGGRVFVLRSRCLAHPDTASVEDCEAG